MQHHERNKPAAITPHTRAVLNIFYAVRRYSHALDRRNQGDWTQGLLMYLALGALIIAGICAYVTHAR